MVFKLVLCFLVGLCLVNESVGWWGSGSSSRSSSRSSSTRKQSRRPHDVKSKSGLTTIYNSEVVRAQRVERPMSGNLGKAGFKHSGVVVTTRNGNKYLVHKGKGYGSSRQTVVTNARHMSKKWRVTHSKSVQGARVGDYVKKGGKDYNVATDNCHDASDRMIKIDGRK